MILEMTRTAETVLEVLLYYWSILIVVFLEAGSSDSLRFPQILPHKLVRLDLELLTGFIAFTHYHNTNHM